MRGDLDRKERFFESDCMGCLVDGFGGKTVVCERFVSWELGAVKNIERI